MGPHTAPDETEPTFPSFVELYDEHVDELYRFVHRRCRDHGLAEDITQDTFMTALRNHDLSEISIGWLKRVARNRLVDVLRRQSREHDDNSALFWGNQMSDDLDSTVSSARGESPSPDFVAALRERIVAESKAAPRTGIAPVTELEIKPLREQGMTTRRKMTIGLVAAAIVVVAGVAAIANSGDSDGLVVADQSTETTSTTASTTTTAESTTTTAARIFTDPAAVLDEYIRTYEEGDGAAFRSIVTREYRFLFVGGGAQVTATDQTRNVSNLAGLSWSLEPIGDVTTTGDGPYEITLEHRITADNYGPEGRVGTSTFTIIDDEGTLKVSRHVYSGEAL